MTVGRRDFLAKLGFAFAAGAAGSACRTGAAQQAAARTEASAVARARTRRAGDDRIAGQWTPADWDSVRTQFDLADDVIHMSALFIASHPRPVREAIERHRRELDRNPVVYLQDRNRPLRDAALGAAARYLGGWPSQIALTDSTTMGLGLVYNGLRLRAGQEFLATEHDYYATHEALRFAAARTGATVRHFSLYRRLAGLSAGEMVDRVRRAIRRNTRVLALTWVSSGTGGQAAPRGDRPSGGRRQCASRGG